MTWRERIVAARKRGGFSAQERDDAASWLSCAVGEQRRLHPDVVLYRAGLTLIEPVDRKLWHLGSSSVGIGGFHRAVQLNQFDEAERLLDAIEDRVLELKRRKKDVQPRTPETLAAKSMSFGDAETALRTTSNVNRRRQWELPNGAVNSDATTGAGGLALATSSRPRGSP